MTIQNPFLILTLVFAVSNVVMTVVVVHALRKRNLPASIVWARFRIIQYLNQYRDATIQEGGKPGFLFYAWIASIDLAFLSLIIALITIN